MKISRLIRRVAVISYFMCLFPFRNAEPPSEVMIGALFDQGSEEENTGVFLTFKMAVDYVNSSPDVLPDTRLVYRTNVSETLIGTFQHIQNTCYQMKQGVTILVGPAASTSVKATYPICAGSHIPQIAPFATDPTLSSNGHSDYPYLLKMSASDFHQSQALVSLVQYYGWTKFAVVAELTDYGRNGIQGFLTAAAKNDWTVAIVEYFNPIQNTSQLDFNQSLLNIKAKGVRVVIVNCMASFARVILDQAYSLGMLSSGWAWIGTDGVTAMDGLYNPCSEVPVHLYGLLGTRPAYGQGGLYPQFSESWANMTRGLARPSAIEVGPAAYLCGGGVQDLSFVQCPPCINRPNANSMRTFDAVLVAAHGLHSYFEAGHSLTWYNQTESVCLNKDTPPREEGAVLMNYLRKVNIEGVMNPLKFTDNGDTTYRAYEIVNLRKNDWRVIGLWNKSNDLPVLEMDAFKKPMFPGQIDTIPHDTALDLTNVSLKIVTILEEPFVVEKNAEEIAQEPSLPKVKGLCVDLMVELKKSLRFNYTLELVKDGNYGSQNKSTGRWNGMIGELLDGRADLAIAPLTINYERQQFVDFTKPYMDLGLSILMAKKTSSSNILGFLEPFQRDLWIAVGVAFVVFGIATACCSFFSPYGYRGRYVQREDRDNKGGIESRNLLTLWDSLWYTYACWMMQGAEVGPRSFSGRIVYGFWWFAVMVISATYTANLAAFLTVARLDTGINSLSELAEQRDIRYGTVANSAPQLFFDSQHAEPYAKMAKYMDRENTSVPNASEGIHLVNESYGKNERDESRYAFIFDSTILEYEASKKPCNKMTIGSIFNQFGYGIALRKNSPYLQAISLEILQFRQNGLLERLRKKHINSGSCDSNSNEQATSKGEQASLQDMQGIFYFLTLGIVAGVLILLGEWAVASCKETWAVHKNDNNKRTCCGALGRRLKALGGDIKHCVCPCCEQKKTDDNDMKYRANGLDNGLVKNGTCMTESQNKGTPDQKTTLSVAEEGKLNTQAFHFGN